jgi:hypothetical protein
MPNPAIAITPNSRMAMYIRNLVMNLGTATLILYINRGNLVMRQKAAG